MKQARWWLLVAAALAVPTAGYAQAKGKKGGGAKAAATVELDDSAAGADANGDIELDEAPPAEAPSDDGPSGGICEIDPTACPKAVDLKAMADKDLKAEVYAVQQAYVLRKHRFEINPFWSASLNDQFVSHPGPGLALNFYLSNVLAVGVSGNYYGGLNVDSDFNFQNRRATRVANPLNEYMASGNVNFTYVPVYGKFSGFSKFIFHYDFYVVGGVGALWTRPIPVIDPDNRNFGYEPKLTIVNPGVGLRIFFNRWFAATLELRDYIYFEKLEALTVAANPTDQNTWTGESRLTNNVQAQLGISVFLPFSWEYKLPK